MSPVRFLGLVHGIQGDGKYMCPDFVCVIFPRSEKTTGRDEKLGEGRSIPFAESYSSAENRVLCLEVFRFVAFNA